MIGIYLIKNKITRECYIGQSINIERRWESHKKDFKSKKYPLYADMRSFGLNYFEFHVLEECQKLELDDKEMKWIKKYQEDGYKLYNIKGVFNKAYYVKRRKNKRITPKF